VSHTVLRRVMIRMLHDPWFAAATYEDPDGALVGLDLSPTERGWLAATPRAAWRVDHDRPGRVLAALAEEYPATVSLAAEQAASFLRSPEFHAAVQDRGSLGLAFGAHLARAPDPRARALARLELAVATVRRAPAVAQPSAPGRLRLSPRVALVWVPSGALELFAAVRRGEAGGALGTDREAALVTLSPSSEANLEPLAPALVQLLTIAGEECERLRLLAAAHGHDLTTDEAAQVIDDLVGDGILV